MSHMVIYRGADGKPGYHQTDDIHDAVMYVEGLRNDKEVDHARIFRLEEVTFEYRPYYRVELSVGGAAVNGSSDTSTLAAAETSDDDDVLETTEAEAEEVDADDLDDSIEDPDDAEDDEVASADDSDDDSDDALDDDIGDGEPVPASGVRRGLFGR